jgi:hypothetical protein
MMTRAFRIDHHEEYGSNGLAPLWMPGYQSDPLPGMGCAHDVLEHGRRDLCEWQGLGGAIFVRALGGYFGRTRGNPDPAENIGADFVDLFRLWEGADIPTCPRTRPLSDDWAESLIIEAVTIGCRNVRAYAVYSGDDDLTAAQTWTRDVQRAHMIGWMRRGFRAARARWHAHDPYILSAAFTAIETTIDAFLHEHGDMHGSTCVLHFDIAGVRAHVQLDEDPYDY